MKVTPSIRSAIPTRLALIALVLAAVGLAGTAPVHAQRGWSWLEEAKITSADGAPDDLFGVGLALEGDTALIGACTDDDLGSGSGSVYVFARSGTTWTQLVKLLASDGAIGDRFGGRIRLDGDTALMTAIYADGAYYSTGAVYVFVGSGSSWTEQAKLTAGDPMAYHGFGGDVAIDGDTALVGAGSDGDVASHAGAAYVFERSGSSWTQTAKLTAGDGEASDYFGRAVALSGDTGVISAWGDDDQGDESGSVYVFVRQGTVWTSQAKLIAPSVNEDDKFGHSVAIEGDTLVVGAVGKSRAFVYQRTGTTWSYQAELAPSVSTGCFGYAVDVEGDTAAVGADGFNPSGPGRAYVYQRTGSTWSEEDWFRPGDSFHWDRFGGAISLSGGTVLVGACNQDGTASSAGSAYSFVRTAVASATARNAGTNPASYDAVTLPVLGATYTGTVDLGGTTGHNLAWLVGYTTPLTQPLGGGQTLLVNVSDPNGELLMQPTKPGPLATYDLSVPGDLGLLGFTLATQALHLGGMQPFALSNAQDLFLGQ